MACEICGRNSCTRSFHSVWEQEAHEADYTESELAETKAENERLEAENARLREDAKTIAEFVYGWWPKLTNGLHAWPPPEDHRLIVAARRILGTDEPRPSEED